MTLRRVNCLNVPLNIALVHTGDTGGGAEQSTMSLYRALKQLGHHCRVFVGAKESDNADVVQISRFRCFPGVLRTAKLLETKLGWQYLYHPWFRRLDRLIGKDIDIVHYQSLWLGREGFADVGALPRLTRIYPSVMTLRDWWMLTGHCAHPAPDCERWKTGCGHCPDLTLSPAITRDGTAFNWRRKKRAIHKSDILVTTVSDWLGELVSDSPIFHGKRTVTVHNGIDERVFLPRKRAEMRRKWNLPEKAFIVMITGQSVQGTSGRNAKDAPYYAVEACKLSGVKPFLLAVGRKSEQVISEWDGAGLALPFQSSQELLSELYCAADIVLVASLWETFGRVPAEAQMCGTPVVAFATGGIPEIVVHQQTGLLAQRLDVNALGSEIAHLHSNEEFRAQLGINGALQSFKRFNNNAIAERYVSIYRDEIARRTQMKKPN